MIVIGNTVLSDDIAEKHFVCDLTRCKGACCVEGDLGAPLTQEELPILDAIADKVRPFMSEAGRLALAAQGGYLKDYEGDYSTSTVNGKECVYAVYDANAVLKCAIEQAHAAGQIDFPKPISCHLYPIRISEYDQYVALNYHQWDICAPACELGRQFRVPVYTFLKTPLIRRFGADWYAQLEAKVKAMEA